MWFHWSVSIYRSESTDQTRGRTDKLEYGWTSVGWNHSDGQNSIQNPFVLVFMPECSSRSIIRTMVPSSSSSSLPGLVLPDRWSYRLSSCQVLLVWCQVHRWLGHEAHQANQNNPPPNVSVDHITSQWGVQFLVTFKHSRPLCFYMC